MRFKVLVLLLLLLLLLLRLRKEHVFNYPDLSEDVKRLY